MEAFSSWWAARFGEVAPRGHLLRVAFEARWLRIHSLPESKRYAETEAEHAEVLHRARTMAGELFAPGDEVWVVAARYELDAPTCQLLGAPALALSFAGQYEPGHDESTLRVYVTRVPWPHAGLDPVLTEIAAWRETVLWVSVERGEVFAPYDGGVDLIVTDRARRDELVRRHIAWRSKHPRGM